VANKGYYDSTELLASIKKRASIPVSQQTFLDEDLLMFADEEISLKIVPAILSVKEEFYVVTEEIPLQANKLNYPIPYRAIGSKVRQLYLKSGDNLSPLAQIQMDHLSDSSKTNLSSNYPGFYIQNGDIMFPTGTTLDTSSSLEVRYYFRPNKLVKLNRGAKIQSINFTTGVITINGTVPSNITAGSQVDLIQANPNHKTYNFDITVQSVTSNTITVAASELPSDLVPGDYVCTSGETVIPQIPSDLHVMLAQAVATRVLEALGDTQGLANATAKLNEMERNLLTVIDSRVESPSRKVVNVNSFLRRRWYR